MDANHDAGIETETGTFALEESSGLHVAMLSIPALVADEAPARDADEPAASDFEPRRSPFEPNAEPAGRVADDDPIAAMLNPFFHKGFVSRRDAKGLMNPANRQEAERRLNAVGLSLAWSPYSRYYGLALADGPGDRKERITNITELDRNALALLVILWARLVLPQRLAEEGREGGVPEPSVTFDALNAEYGKKLGGRRFEMYISQLKRMGFLEYTRKDDIKAGPFLDLLGDSNQLASYLRQSTLAKVIGEQPTVGGAFEADDDEDMPETDTEADLVSSAVGERV